MYARLCMWQEVCGALCFQRSGKGSKNLRQKGSEKRNSRGSVLENGEDWVFPGVAVMADSGRY